MIAFLNIWAIVTFWSRHSLVLLFLLRWSNKHGLMLLSLIQVIMSNRLHAKRRWRLDIATNDLLNFSIRVVDHICSIDIGGYISRCVRIQLLLRHGYRNRVNDAINDYPTATSETCVVIYLLKCPREVFSQIVYIVLIIGVMTFKGPNNPSI